MTTAKASAPFKRILVLVDSTESSHVAVELASAIAAAEAAELTALAFVEIDTLKQLLSAKLLSAVEMEDFEAGLVDSAKRQLGGAAETARKSGINIKTEIILGNSAEKIPQIVNDRNADLIVIGAFDSNSARSDLIARQRMQIVDNAPCGVLVARQP